MIPISARSGKPDRKLPDHFASAVIAPDPAEELEAGPDHLGETVEDFGEVAARLLLDRHRDGKEAQILHIQPFGHPLERFANVAAIGCLVRDHAHFGPERIGYLLATMFSADENGWPTRSERTISSTASGNCSSSIVRRFLARLLIQT